MISDLMIFSLISLVTCSQETSHIKNIANGGEQETKTNTLFFAKIDFIPDVLTEEVVENIAGPSKGPKNFRAKRKLEDETPSDGKYLKIDVQDDVMPSFINHHLISRASDVLLKFINYLTIESRTLCEQECINKLLKEVYQKLKSVDYDLMLAIGQISELNTPVMEHLHRSSILYSQLFDQYTIQSAFAHYHQLLITILLYFNGKSVNDTFKIFWEEQILTPADLEFYEFEKMTLLYQKHENEVKALIADIIKTRFE